ncbi:MAG: hypothetical protein J6A59_17085 [Lachnospiraceae bacterium]|nr:hypothetical protein [Lachnospiraceae bacterium]
MKTKRKSFKALLVLAVMLISLFGSTLTVFAADEYTDSKQAVSDWAPGGSKNADGKVMPPALAGYVKTSSFTNGTNKIETTTVNGVSYYWDETLYGEAIRRAGDSLNKKEAAKLQDQANLATFSEVTDTMALSADVGTASGILSGLMGPLRTLLGIIVVLASVGMTVFSGFDICYIAFPVFRNKCEEAKQNGTGPMVRGNKTGSGGEAKLRFVSDDAQYAVVAADTVQSGKNPFVIYFGKRLLSYVVLAILLFILLTGRVTIFTDLALKVVSGLLDIIQSI